MAVYTRVTQSQLEAFIQNDYLAQLVSFEGIKDVVDGIKNWFDKIGFDFNLGLEDETGEVPTVYPEHAQATRSLVLAIEKMKASPKTNCFYNYKQKDYGTNNGFPDLSEKRTVIELSEDTILVKTLDGKQVDTKLSNELNQKMAGFKPCLIYGDFIYGESIQGKVNGKSIPKNFYANFLEGPNCAGCNQWECPENCVVPYWVPVDQITIQGTETIISTINSNREAGN